MVSDIRWSLITLKSFNIGGRGLSKPKHIGRVGVLVGFIVDNLGKVQKARIKFDDSGRVGKLDLDDLVEV